MNLTISLAQLNFIVGDITGNLQKIIQSSQIARDTQSADIILFPELCLTGYPPEDLLLKDDLSRQVFHALEQLCTAVTGIHMVVGYPRRVGTQLFNSASVIYNGKIQLTYDKQYLPNYGVFDEQRYFSAGHSAACFTLKGHTLGLTVCEDIWQEAPIQQAQKKGVDILLNLNASPYHQGKPAQRLTLLKEKAQTYNMDIVYSNLIGGQDELIFDGGSMVVDQQGQLQLQAIYYQEDQPSVQWIDGKLQTSELSPSLNEETEIYQALVLAVKDYVTKNGFNGVLLGLSGGIDSALVLAIAVDALGAEQVEVLLMPSRYTADMSNLDAIKQAEILGVTWQSIPIEPAFNAFLSLLETSFQGTQKDTTEENIQARCRGILLMALSNKTGKMLLTTGNKSEMSVGYATLYGDMAGGYAPIKDLPKLLVYRLARYCNRHQEIIPQRVIDRPPSAELAPDQKDSDSLPDYAILDEILRQYIEEDASQADIIRAGFTVADVKQVTRLVDINEHKRYQAPPGAKITRRAFGRDRRYPLVNHFKS